MYFNRNISLLICIFVPAHIVYSMELAPKEDVRPGTLEYRQGGEVKIYNYTWLGNTAVKIRNTMEQKPLASLQHVVISTDDSTKQDDECISFCDIHPVVFEIISNKQDPKNEQLWLRVAQLPTDLQRKIIGELFDHDELATRILRGEYSQCNSPSTYGVRNFFMHVPNVAPLSYSQAIVRFNNCLVEYKKHDLSFVTFGEAYCMSNEQLAMCMYVYSKSCAVEVNATQASTYRRRSDNAISLSLDQEKVLATLPKNIKDKMQKHNLICQRPWKERFVRAGGAGCKEFLDTINSTRSCEKFDVLIFAWAFFWGICSFCYSLWLCSHEFPYKKTIDQLGTAQGTSAERL